ncbi:uncharacterized aarF domain-containing protein kinase At1g71810, chloroplastic-like [Gastrolobium bilobum]|uniref:uncharacterized aarF domain-containing protein kinase At1g71810, chloroplastic-like n=1 Tax=Gastrolobium bilobum TaxID=150636 RepID=UPI002AAF1086|nr:uncharacterized aarF domain-containing protein kinase At1g71810, chloroplastic-like [Gastrolobium bilobum]
MLILPMHSLSSFPSLASLRFQPQNRTASRRCSVRCAAASYGGEADTFTAKSGYLFELSATEADSLAEYRISKIAAIYYRKPLVVARRLLQTGFAFGKWFGLRYLDTLFDRSDEMFEVRAAELRRILVELGPAYIKIAQAISSRADLIPPSYLNELSLLQDRISPFSTEIAFSMIEQELGLSLDEIFSEISPEPVAAASLGQVYQARLRKTGQVVAVKVQRPGVQAAISLDILILRFVVGLIRRAGKLNTDLQAVVDEWASSLFRDLATGKTIGSAKEQGGLYYLVSQSPANKVTYHILMSHGQSTADSLIWLHHKRLGHPPFSLLKSLFPSLFLSKSVESFHCDVCEFAKHHRVSFPSSITKSVTEAVRITWVARIELYASRSVVF